MEIRKDFAHGHQRDYFDDPMLVGWTREGSDEGAGCAVVLSRRELEPKRMKVGEAHAGETWVCVLGEEGAAAEVDDEGWATFPGTSTLLSVYLPKEAADTLSNIPILVRPGGEQEGVAKAE